MPTMLTHTDVFTDVRGTAFDWTPQAIKTCRDAKHTNSRLWLANLGNLNLTGATPQSTLDVAKLVGALQNDLVESGEVTLRFGSPANMAYVATHLVCPDRVLDALTCTPHFAVLRGLTRRPGLPRFIAEQLAGNPSAHVRAALLRNPDVDEDLRVMVTLLNLAG